MALIHEDGNGLATAESYVSVADSNIYHYSRGNKSWADFTPTLKEQLLRKATDYMIQVYTKRWNGYRYVSGQALDWPRDSVYLSNYLQPELVANNIVPIEVKNACCELAFKANSTTLLEDLDKRVTREKIDVIEVEYGEYSQENTRYASIDAMLSIYFNSTTGGIVGRVERG